MVPKIMKLFNNSEDIEELNLIDRNSGNNMSWLQAYIKDLSKAPVAKQTAVGGISGWVVGYVSMKVGKLAATVVGGTIILMQLAAYQGYIKVDWSKVNKDLNKNAQNFTKEVKSKMTSNSAKTKSVKPSSITSFIDRKIDENINKYQNLENKTESWVNRNSKLVRKWYRKSIMGEKDLTIQDLYAINVWLMSFSVGTMIGVACGKAL